jgi:hypothetical protein
MAHLTQLSAILGLGLAALPAAASAKGVPFTEEAYNACNAKMDAADQALLTADRTEAAAKKAAVITSRWECAMLHESWLEDATWVGDDRATVEQVYAGIVGELAYFAAEGGECIKARGWFGKRSNLPAAALDAGQTTAIAAVVNSCVDTSKPIEEAPPKPARPMRTWGYSLLSAGAASVVGGIVYNASGATTRSDYDDAYAACKADPAGCDRDAVNQLAAEIDDAKLPLAILYGFGAAALGTGGTFLLLDWMDKDATAHASLRVSPTGATVRFEW